jgi:serine/threonine protein kinase
LDKRYEVYCLADRLFYDSPTSVQEVRTEFDATRRPAAPGWRRTELDDWVVHRPDGVLLPKQGWKVHVSACLDNAAETLTATWEYCLRRGVTFKFLRDRNALLLANAKYADRGASGKFLTLYPLDETELEQVLTELGAVLAGRAGPYILSDLRCGEGPLYVRYGGFAERYCASAGGRMELAIEDPSGTLVPDRREPAFRLPPWVQLPEFLKPHLEARTSMKVDELPYRIEQALHFSNGGGLYSGTDLRTGDRIVLKEARPHAGLDVDGTDAVARLLRERDILHRLDGLGTVPAAREHFTLGEHHFLVLDFIDATPLRTEIVKRYPLTEQETDPQAAADYTDWALDIAAKVEQLIAEVHGRGIVVGDLHPFNVLLRPDGRIALVDFEVAAPVSEGRRQTLADPGFAAPEDRTGFDIDRYALACLRLFLFLPLTTLLAMDQRKADDFAAAIAAQFPVPSAFLDEAVRTIAGSTGSPGPRPPRCTPDPPGWERVRDSMAAAIVRSATPERDDRLFPGDIEQFVTGGLNLAHGAAGVLYALAATGAGRFPEYEEWLARRAVQPEMGSTRLGFYDGLHGVAHVLDQLGHGGEARKVLEICSTELDGRWQRMGLDLHGGLAGIGLNLLHFARCTGDASLHGEALKVAAAVAERLGDEDDVATVSGGAHSGAGLLRGSSGPALLFLRVAEDTGDQRWLAPAATALRQDLRRCLLREDGSLEVNEGWRTMPYLGEGSVGIAFVLDEYLAHRPDGAFAAAAAQIRRAAQAQFYVEPGLFAGRAGMILYLSRAHPAGWAARDPDVAAQIRRLDWHAMSCHGELAFPGEQLLRLSMDLATGTAGVLLALGAALHDGPVHLPFLPPPAPDGIAG